ncbi:Fe-S cluster protein [Erythrobacter sp. SAORIC-644]|jgi:NifU-like protein involved in Fe-S cluster formation|uniref:iron-sulfur cluster assembly scaffold protein n=1 Tax=Erythrobacter sp. SAORIC-644 TaxID=1869314 RepID=UPI000C10154C|nr:iron-sulfur cluster assembly scaffold protein [Erythrobacter sp. SAORIC-644]MAG40441.1 Fe-S cluster protein [Erythrobacteraceae bacterium]MBL4896414.1 iron-sulfur cluster assembly scaffold protein [Erythrobacter sp.]QPL38718.1 iron-sulfur cluster assembly scaffold protein [Erythrobacter sp. A30-3]MAP70016.1 Fe-S cluster protein [Erythrobacteraceae bacterium]PHR05758.1 MAG: Fe-S cluster protein [Erythrobacter sp.]|tara:strand:- start:376 stop:807 length:432 start_codon:yes stop_codon:yes gene_type:complete
MASSRAPALYSTELLALAIELADYPFDAAAPAKGHARSRSCGSVIDLSSSGGSLEDLGLRVSACAVGQASAAIFARESSGMDAAAVAAMVENLGEWLQGQAPSSILPRLELLEPARPHLGRHEAILLPWRAALDALSKTEAAR